MVTPRRERHEARRAVALPLHRTSIRDHLTDSEVEVVTTVFERVAQAAARPSKPRRSRSDQYRDVNGGSPRRLKENDDAAARREKHNRPRVTPTKRLPARATSLRRHGTLSVNACAASARDDREGRTLPVNKARRYRKARPLADFGIAKPPKLQNVEDSPG